MEIAIFIGSIVLIALFFIIWNTISNTKIKNRYNNLNYKDKVRLRFVRTFLGDYVIEFYNPVFRCWWELPAKQGAAIHGVWKLNQVGSYGAYGLAVLKCEESEIERVKKAYETLEDIKLYFEELEAEYDSWQKYKSIQESKPKVIY